MCVIHLTRHHTCLEYSACENCLCLVLLCSILLSNGGVSRLLHVDTAFSLCNKLRCEFHTATMDKLICWAITMTCTPPIIVACKIWQKPWPSLYKLLPSMKAMPNNICEIKEEDVRLWGGWKVHIVGSYNPWKTQGGKQPRHVLSDTLPVTMALV